MWKLGLLLLTILFGMTFMILPQWDGETWMTPDPFWFMDFGYNAKGERLGICYQTYIYMVGGHLNTIFYSWIMWVESDRYRNAMQVFFWLQVLDLIDFLLSYNTLGGNFYGVPVTCNTITCAVFGATIIYYWFWKPAG